MTGYDVEKKSAPEADHDHAPGRGAPPVMSEVDNLLLRMEVLEPGDFKLLAKILGDHPDLRDVIIAKAQEVCGNATVTKALELLAHPKPAAAAESAASSATTPPSPEKTAEDTTNAKHGGKQEPKEFDYIVSFLALEYDRSEKIKDHVEFIEKNPHLRDKVLAGAGEFDPALAAEVEQALRGKGKPPVAEHKQAAPDAAAPAHEPEKKKAEKFEYIVSPLALEYDREEKIKDHVDFIHANPQLRDQVLIGAAEFDAPLAEEVRKRLEDPKPAATSHEAEQTPADVIQKDAEQAAPSAAPEKKHHHHGHAHDAGETKKEKPESSWVTRARAYNAAHWDTVNAFLQITGGACLDAEGKVDPNLVAQWQAAHGTPPDGRIGEATVAAAILDSPVDAPIVAQQAAEPNPNDPPRAA